MEDVRGVPVSARARRVRWTDVVGQLVPRRSIAAGAQSCLAFWKPHEKFTAEMRSTVEVSSGLARLSFEGRADAGGRRGDLIPVRNPERANLFRARVEGAGQSGDRRGIRGCGSGTRREIKCLRSSSLLCLCLAR